MYKIPFTQPAILDDNLGFVAETFENGWIAGDGPFTKKSQQLLEKQIDLNCKVLLTTSCTHALEMAAILLNITPGDEVIVPSYTFVSTALAFYMRGANIVFSDIREDTLNIDELQLDKLITDRTRVIVVVHYAGVACEMDRILELSKKYNIDIVEDNAHGLYGKYKNKNLGSFGCLATQSFHETKNISCGEGGALVINNKKLHNRAEIIREKGTNRAKFFRGQVDKYTWVDKGSSYVMSDILAAVLYKQLLSVNNIQNKRKHIWQTYSTELAEWASKNSVKFPFIPDYCNHTYHIFYLLFPNIVIRNKFIDHLSGKKINATFHYQPLHSSSFGKKLSDSEYDICPVTTKISDCLVRMPLFYGMTEEQLEYTIDAVKEFK
jgi:dTDP-4-amino-4,6-dideoxygalactose transaminase